MSRTNWTGHGVAALLWVGLGAIGAGATSPEQEATLLANRLQQEVATLRNQLDYKTQQLERSITFIDTRLQRLETRQPLVAPEPAAAAPLTRDALANGGAAELRTRRLIVEDERGRARVVLTESERFGPMLGLLDEHGEVLATLAAGGNGPRLELFDAFRVPRAVLALEGPAVGLSLMDAEGELRARLQVVGTEAKLEVDRGTGR